MEPMQPIKGQFQSRDANDSYSGDSGKENLSRRGSDSGILGRLLGEDGGSGGRQARDTKAAPRREGRRRAINSGVRGKERRGLDISGSMAVKVAVCMVALLICAAVKLSDAEIAQKASQLMQNALTYDVDVEENLGQLKFVQRLFPGVATVFNGSNGMRYPVDGNITKAFEELGTGIEITSSEGTTVVAAMDGVVEKRGKNAEFGNYLRIKHSGSMDTYYFGLKRSTLNEGDSVARGQEIAELGEEGVLIFEVHVRGIAKNPMEYLGKN